MAEENKNQNQKIEDITDAEIEAEELDILKTRAKTLGINFPNNIKLDGIRAKLEEYKAQNEVQLDEAKKEAVGNLNPSAFKKKHSALVRFRITSHDPKDKEATGVLVDVSNDVLHFKKFIEFDVPWHAPMMVVNFLRGKEIQKFRDTKKNNNAVDGIPSISKESYMTSKYAIEMLEPLTKAELKKLAEDQSNSKRQ